MASQTHECEFEGFRFGRQGRLSRQGTVVAALAVLIAVAAAAPQPAVAFHDEATATETPAGFDRFMVFMAAGFFNPDDPNYAAPDPLSFQTEVMGRDAEAIARDKQDAIKFFSKRFGLDLVSPSLRGRVRLEPFTRDARRDLKAYVISGQRIPSSGWAVREGGWILTILDPDGVELGREFAGVTAPAGTTFVFGEYSVEVTATPIRRFWRLRPVAPIVVRFQSWEPCVPNSDGSRMVRLELSHPDWGTGLAQGTVADDYDPYRGGVTANVRTVITFPAPRR